MAPKQLHSATHRTHHVAGLHHLAYPAHHPTHAVSGRLGGRSHGGVWQTKCKKPTCGSRDGNRNQD
jgi:hypothetical protein